MAASPSTPNKLNKSDPIRLPIDMPWRPRKTPINEVASSGAEVPAATMVTPMTHSDSPKVRAISVAASTK